MTVAFLCHKFPTHVGAAPSTSGASSLNHAPSPARSSGDAWRSQTQAAGSAATAGCGVLMLGGIAGGLGTVASRRKQRCSLYRRAPGRPTSLTASETSEGVGAVAAEAPLESLAAALELAERIENYGEAARLRDELREVEAARPMVALLWRQRQRIKRALDVALIGPVGDNGANTAERRLQARLEAIDALKDMATPPSAAGEAEDALHRVLREAPSMRAADDEGRDEMVDVICTAAEDALWSCWHSSGDEEIEEAMSRGMAFMDKKRFSEAVTTFSEMITYDPLFAEGWNKRATAHYMAGNFDQSIADCFEVLKLKPRHFGCLSGLGMCYRSKGEDDQSLTWLRKSLEVYPGLAGPQKLVNSTVIQKRLNPLISMMMASDALKSGGCVKAPTAGLKCTWDVHQVRPEKDAKDVCIYFFRVTTRNEYDTPTPLKSLARFYVLSFADGKVFPFTRPTDGDSGFQLLPGEEYKFCWVLIVSSELRGAGGGVLLEDVSTAVDAAATPANELTEVAASQYPRACFEPVLTPSEADVVSMEELERLGDGYFFTGQLDLRRAAGL
mmetsp:Transcript_60994/g.174886  ORF Transcript_60994/g.174886 Transcript_60994/m.174886 type:complete len:558 (-) Transcript_60994:373-2046(-)